MANIMAFFCNKSLKPTLQASSNIFYRCLTQDHAIPPENTSPRRRKTEKHHATVDGCEILQLVDD